MRSRFLLFVCVAFAAANVRAQNPVVCNAIAIPEQIRAEGLAERVGEILLTCTGGVAGQVLPLNVSVALNTNDTSRVLATGVEEALLVIDELTQPPVPGINLYQGSSNSAGNQVDFLNVQFTAPGPGQQRYLRIANLRVNGRALYSGGTPGLVIASVIVPGSQAPIVNTPNQVVAYVAQGMAFDLRTASGTASGTMTFQQSGGRNAALALSPAATGGMLDYTARFTEIGCRVSEFVIPALHPQTPPDWPTSLSSERRTARSRVFIAVPCRPPTT